MVTLQETNPEQAAFYVGLFNKAVAAYTKEDYVSVHELVSTNMKDICDHMDLEMVRLGFEFGRMYERLGVLV
ncbi:hypothetical protein IMSAGC013_02577 [Lachnospiraceae bacterium]|nr:hypothetical protein IMSAGC013_02577 [Lachnospiraceae bacterium]